MVAGSTDKHCAGRLLHLLHLLHKCPDDQELGFPLAHLTYAAEPYAEEPYGEPCQEAQGP